LANQPRSSWPSARQASGSGSLARSQEILAGPQYARRVREEEFTYPPYGLPLVEAYDSRFEAVFVLLHPFIQMPERLSWTATHQYPTDADVLIHGSRYPWSEVCRETGLASCARISQALLTSTGSLRSDLADRLGCDALQSFLQSQPVCMPTEGRFEPILQRDFLRAFAAAGCKELLYVPEFPDSEPLLRLPVDGLRHACFPFPGCGTLPAPDASFLFTVDWDSFFTLFYGSKAFITQMATELDFEGFFATPNTDHAWFNYSLGCATVTLSPEHWQMV
jgi:hypothetical protein